MRKIFIALGVITLLGLMAYKAPTACSSPEALPASDTIPDAPIIDTLIDVEENSVAVIDYNFGDSLTIVDDITYYITYVDGEDQDVSSIDGSVIIAVRDTLPVDTCIIKGEYNHLGGHDSVLEIVSGIDTLRYRIDKLPKKLDVTSSLALKGSKATMMTHTFALSDASWPCGVVTQFYVLPDEGEWLYDCFNTIIHNDIDGLMMSDSVSVVRHYRGNKRDLKAMGRFYAKEFERLYRRDYDIPDEDGRLMGPKYDYLFRAMPVWESSDKNLVTYKLYNYQYLGGAHGGMFEYFFTFNRKTGKLLGAKDIFTTEGFPRAIQELEKQLRIYKINNGYRDREWEANLDKEAPVDGLKYDLKESVGAHVYPRPAFTRHGVVFSYQPYEMGSFAEGIIHLVLPYNVIDTRAVR